MIFREGPGFFIMMCERCGNDFADSKMICPHCGIVRPHAQGKQPATNYGSFAPPDFAGSPPYQPGDPAAHQPGANPPPYIHSNAAGAHFPPHTQYMAGPSIQSPLTSSKSDAALITEIILSLFGIFGVGWIMAGETTLGTILIVCSLFIYWPIMILGTAFTLGFGLLCLGPLAIAAIIINALLLNARLKRQSQRFFVPPPPPYIHHRPQ
jgi:hypothetical protein